MGKVLRYRLNLAELGAPEPPPTVVASVEALISDPVEVLGDRTLWPTLDDVTVATALLTMQYQTWLTGRAVAAGGAWEQAIRWNPAHGAPATPEAQALVWMKRHLRWPYPVGRGCAIVQDGFPAAPVRDLLPFDGDAHAALILPVSVGATRMDMFCLVERQPRQTMLAGEWLPLPDGWGTAGDVRRWMEQGEPEASDVLTVWNACREWWCDLSGNPLKRGRGRPRGSGQHREFLDFVKALRFYRYEISAERPSSINDLYNVLPDDDAKRQFLAKQWVVSQDKLERLLYTDWQVGWPEVVAMVYGPKD